MLDRLERLPIPQRNALATVFGLSEGPAPDRFLVGLATLTLLAEVAEHQPLLCIVEDAQWLDQASAQLLGFVARRLLAERVALICAARTGSGDHVLAGLPALAIGGLGDSDARALLLDNVHGPLDVAVCDQIVTESHGNPLALLELPRAWNDAALAGGFGLPGSQPMAGKIEQSYVRRLRLLPADTQLLVLAAAAEPLGDPVLFHRAAATLDLDMAAVAPVVDAGLLQVGGGWSSPIRWCGRPLTARLGPGTATGSIAPWLTPPMPRRIRIGGPGIWLRRRRVRGSRSRLSSSARRVGPRLVAGWRPRRRFCGGRSR
jgi:hypothetical protein